MHVNLVSTNDTPITSPSQTSVDLISSDSGLITFYEDADCSGSPISGSASISFAPSVHSRKISYRLSRESTNPFFIESKIGSNNSKYLNKTAQPGFVSYVSTIMDSNLLTLNLCYELRITPFMVGSILATLPRQFQMNNSTFDYYLDPNCSSTVYGTGAPISTEPYNGVYYLYVKPKSTGINDISFNILNTPTSGGYAVDVVSP